MSNEVIQDETDILIQNELDKVAEILKDEVYTNYCTYEDEVGELIDKYCPICKKEIKNTTMGISILMANIRNYIRFKGNIKFEGIDNQ